MSELHRPFRSSLGIVHPLERELVGRVVGRRMVERRLRTVPASVSLLASLPAVVGGPRIESELPVLLVAVVLIVGRVGHHQKSPIEAFRCFRMCCWNDWGESTSSFSS